VAILAMNFWKNDFGQNPIEHTFQRINQNFIQKKLVDSLVVFNKTVEVYLDMDSLKKPEHAATLKSLKDNVKGPHYAFTIGNFEQFRDDMKDAQQNFAPNELIQITYHEDSKSSWIGLLVQFVLPIVIMIGLWVLIMRKMGGGANGGGPGGIFSIGKSKAQLFETLEQSHEIDFTTYEKLHKKEQKQKDSIQKDVTKKVTKKVTKPISK
jgi:cell division protease FtsH